MLSRDQLARSRRRQQTAETGSWRLLMQWTRTGKKKATWPNWSSVCVAVNGRVSFRGVENLVQSGKICICLYCIFAGLTFKGKNENTFFNSIFLPHDGSVALLNRFLSFMPLTQESAPGNGGKGWEDEVDALQSSGDARQWVESNKIIYVPGHVCKRSLLLKRNHF